MGQPRWATTSDQYILPTAGDAWAAEASAGGERGSQRILSAGTIPAPDDIAEGPRAGTSVVARRRLILADDRPVEIACSYWPASIAGMTILAEPEKVSGGTARFLAEVGYEPHEVHEDITAAAAQAVTSLDERMAMQLGDGDPVLVLTRIVLDAAGQPYQVDVNVMVAGRHTRYVRSAG
ncbi:UTRA domain-containing protein [Micromonospora sp. NBC_01655]|uniref:UTRA domain-containing protein n=1 Tax=Micromonospora sp. NBC_01655 TaxID=2975983 RepID=UPI00224FF5CF|nr:UTRA domain-containing protein [Micromonospora sp. NBC_01655]MCX4474769.1 UTRA domain-containing protein [Micromonospora sp. NBC_01655]